MEDGLNNKFYITNNRVGESIWGGNGSKLAFYPK